MVRLLAAVLAATLAVAPAVAGADEDAEVAEARRLYNEATRAFKDARHRDAALAFEAASRLKPHAVALYTAAQAWEAAGEPARAADAYALAILTPTLSVEQGERAHTRLTELRQELGTVGVVGNVEGRVQLDDHSEVQIPATLHGTPGEHTLLVIRADGTADRRKVTLVAGESVEVDAGAVEAEPADTPPAKALAEPRTKGVTVEAATGDGRSRVLETVGFVAAGAGLATLGGAALLGVSASSAEDTYKRSPTRATLDHARGLETRTNVLLVVGGVLTVGGVGLVVWQSTKAPGPAEAQVGLGAGSVWAKGRF